MNYTDLKTAVRDTVEVDIPDAVLDMLTRQAEQLIYNTVQLPAIRQDTTVVTTIGNQYLNAPAGWLFIYSLAVVDGAGDYQYLLNKDVNFIREAYPDSADQGIPKHYAIFGPQSAAPSELTFIVGPTPDAAYTVELHYYFYPESIVTASTTWLGDNFDTVLLYGSLVEAYTFLKGEPDLIALYDAKYKEALAMAKRLGDGMDRQDAYRSGQYRQPVNCHATCTDIGYKL